MPIDWLAAGGGGGASAAAAGDLRPAAARAGAAAAAAPLAQQQQAAGQQQQAAAGQQQQQQQEPPALRRYAPVYAALPFAAGALLDELTAELAATPIGPVDMTSEPRITTCMGPFSLFFFCPDDGPNGGGGGGGSAAAADALGVNVSFAGPAGEAPGDARVALVVESLPAPAPADVGGSSSGSGGGDNGSVSSSSGGDPGSAGSSGNGGGGGSSGGAGGGAKVLGSALALVSAHAWASGGVDFDAFVSWPELKAAVAAGRLLRATLVTLDAAPLGARTPALRIPPWCGGAGAGAFGGGPLSAGAFGLGAAAAGPLALGAAREALLRFADVTLLAGAARLRAHRLALAAASPAFEAMLAGSMAEAGRSEIELLDADPEAAALLLDHIMGAPIDVPLELSLALLALADRYQLRTGLARQLELALATARVAPAALAALLPGAQRLCAWACRANLYDQAAAALCDEGGGADGGGGCGAGSGAATGKVSQPQQQQQQDAKRQRDQQQQRQQHAGAAANLGKRRRPADASGGGDGGGDADPPAPSPAAAITAGLEHLPLEAVVEIVSRCPPLPGFKAAAAWAAAAARAPKPQAAPAAPSARARGGGNGSAGAAQQRRRRADEAALWPRLLDAVDWAAATTADLRAIRGSPGCARVPGLSERVFSLLEARLARLEAEAGALRAAAGAARERRRRRRRARQLLGRGGGGGGGGAGAGGRAGMIAGAGMDGFFHNFLRHQGAFWYRDLLSSDDGGSGSDHDDSDGTDSETETESSADLTSSSDGVGSTDDDDDDSSGSDGSDGGSEGD